MSNGYTRPSYLLVDNGVALLTLDAEITPPFATGQHVELYNATTGTSDGWYVVGQVQRRVAYHATPVHGDRVPLAGQEVTVELERLNNTEEKNHAEVLLR